LRRTQMRLVAIFASPLNFRARTYTLACTNFFRENLRIFPAKPQHHNNILREKLYANWEMLTGEVLYYLLDAYAALVRAMKKRHTLVTVLLHVAPIFFCPCASEITHTLYILSANSAARSYNWVLLCYRTPRLH